MGAAGREVRSGHAYGIKDRGAVRCLPQTGDKGIYLKQELKGKLIEHKQYIDKYGVDLPEVRNWKWGDRT